MGCLSGPGTDLQVWFSSLVCTSRRTASPSDEQTDGISTTSDGGGQGVSMEGRMVVMKGWSVRRLNYEVQAERAVRRLAERRKSSWRRANEAMNASTKGGWARRGRCRLCSDEKLQRVLLGKRRRRLTDKRGKLAKGRAGIFNAGKEQAETELEWRNGLWVGKGGKAQRPSE